VALSGYCNHKHCPHHLRRVRLKDPETEKTLVFLSKLFGSPFMTFHAVCVARSQVESFSEQITVYKQFCSASENYT